jgi:hypothetical protein
MQALLEVCAIQLISIGRRMQRIEIAKRARGAAQHYLPPLARDLAKPGIVHDFPVIDEAFLQRASIQARCLLWKGVLRLNRQPAMAGPGGRGAIARERFLVIESKFHNLLLGVGFFGAIDSNLARIASLLAVPTILSRTSPLVK